MTAYTTPDAVAAYLGVTFTPEQATATGAVIDAVTAYIDRYTGRSWQGTSPVLGELRRVIPPLPGGSYPASVAFLAYAPVLGVDAVSIRSGTPNATTTALDPSEYELLDAEHGVIALSAWCDAWYDDAFAVVDYTRPVAVPPDITLAATMIASAEMSRQLAIQSSASASSGRTAGLEGVKSLSVGQNDIAVTFAEGASAASSGGGARGSSYAPPGSAARTILDGYKRVVIA